MTRRTGNESRLSGNGGSWSRISILGEDTDSFRGGVEGGLEIFAFSVKRSTPRSDIFMGVGLPELPEELSILSLSLSNSSMNIPLWLRFLE